MDNRFELQQEITHEEASYGGSRFRLEYDSMERDRGRTPRFWEHFFVGIGFGAVTVIVTMVLIAVGVSPI